MLAHDAWESMDWCWDQGVTFLQFPKREMEGFFVPVKVSIIKVGIFIEPKGEAEGRPAALFVNEDLAGLKLSLPGRAQAATTPDRGQLFILCMVIIGPENCAGRMELRRVKQELGIRHGYVIGIQEENLAKRGMKDGIGLEFPSAKTAGWKFFTEFAGINALNTQRGEQRFHALIQFVFPEMPELHRQPTAQPAQHINANPGIGEVFDSTAADHDTPATVLIGIRRDAGDELVAGHSRRMKVQGMLVIWIPGGGGNAAFGRRRLRGGQILSNAAIEIRFEATDDLRRSDHFHAVGKPGDDIQAALCRAITFVTIPERRRSVFPTTSVGAARQSTIGVDKLVAGISLPVSRFAAAGNYNTRPVPRQSRPAFDGGGQMHQSGDGTKHPLRMINQSDQFTQICPSAQINGSLQPGMVMILSAYLNELDATAKMVNDRLVTVGLPPFDGNIKLPTRGHDPKRSIFTGN